MLDRDDVSLGIQLIARTFLAAAVQFLPAADRYLRDGQIMLRASTDAGDPATPDLLQITTLPQMKTIATCSIGRAYLLLGELAESRLWLGRALDTEAALYPPYRIHTLGSLAICEALAGRLQIADQYAAEALELAREFSLLTHPAPADAYIAVALIAIQRGRPESGALALHEGWVRAASNNRRQLMWIAHAASRLIDPTGTDVAAIPPDGPPPDLVTDVLQGIEARRLRNAGSPNGRRDSVESWSFSTFEEVAALLARGDTAAARALIDSASLAHTLELAQTVELDILRGWLYDNEGNLTRSRTHLIAALRRATPDHLVHPFLRAGERVLVLIAALPGEPGTLRREVVSNHRANAARSSEALAEPLTVRELELLAYLPTRLTNRDLAAQCFVSINTVKTHLGHIYRKLDVTDRNNAVARARELGLLNELDRTRIEELEEKAMARQFQSVPDSHARRTVHRHSTP